MARGHEGKVAVVTGAASGIGQAVARRLAEDGVRIVIADRSAADDTLGLVRAAGRDGIAVACDVSDPVNVAALAQEADRAFGRCDILVNNAGIYPTQAFDDISFEDWRRVLSVNLDAMFLTTKAFYGGMRQRKWGRIVNLASDLISLNVPGFTHYMASKSGVVGLTRALATELGPHGITANIIAPGQTRTPGTLARKELPGGMSQDDFFELVASTQSIKRVGQVDDIVGTISFLTSDDAAFVTGQTIFVDGGHVRA
jgi:NAD(P)-dependent dehydrogenase (short-subunit alcohol dehydrogenase family)